MIENDPLQKQEIPLTEGERILKERVLQFGQLAREFQLHLDPETQPDVLDIVTQPSRNIEDRLEWRWFDHTTITGREMIGIATLGLMFVPDVNDDFPTGDIAVNISGIVYMADNHSQQASAGQWGCFIPKGVEDLTEINQQSKEELIRIYMNFKNRASQISTIDEQNKILHYKLQERIQHP